METRHFERLLPGCGDERQAQPCFSLHITYPEITAAATPELQARLNAHIRAALQPAGAPSGFEEESVQLLEMYQNRTRTARGDDEPAWFVRRTAEVVHSTAASLAIRVERTEYLGGVESSTTYECLNLDPATGEPLKLEDLLVSGAEEELRKLAEKKFREERKIPEGRLLSEGGYTFLNERFTLPPRFLVEKRGIEFMFNPRELTREGTSPVRLLLPYKEISKMIRRETGIIPTT